MQNRFQKDKSPFVYEILRKKKERKYRSYFPCRMFFAADLIEFFNLVRLAVESFAIISIVLTNSSAAKSTISERRMSFFFTEEDTEARFFFGVAFWILVFFFWTMMNSPRKRIMDTDSMNASDRIQQKVKLIPKIFP